MISRRMLEIINRRTNFDTWCYKHVVCTFRSLLGFAGVQNESTGKGARHRYTSLLPIYFLFIMYSSLLLLCCIMRCVDNWPMQLTKSGHSVLKYWCLQNGAIHDKTYAHVLLCFNVLWHFALSPLSFRLTSLVMYWLFSNFSDSKWLHEDRWHQNKKHNKLIGLFHWINCRMSRRCCNGIPS